MPIKCFMLEPTNQQRRYLRRYSTDGACNGRTYHDTMVPVGDAEEHWENNHWVDDNKSAKDYAGDSRWPTTCTHCGYAFQEKDERQLFSSHLYFRSDTGEIIPLRDAPEGAMYYADWYSDIPSWTGPDGKALICIVPKNHPWHIDGRCSNCTRPEDSVHKCWVRHGVPPNITVDKDGDTCSAGAGSILTKDWHGFLRGGELVE